MVIESTESWEDQPLVVNVSYMRDNTPEAASICLHRGRVYSWIKNWATDPGCVIFTIMTMLIIGFFASLFLLALKEDSDIKIVHPHSMLPTQTNHSINSPSDY